VTLPDRATVWLRSPSGRCEPVEVDIDPPDTLAALAKWERVTGRTDRCVVTVRPAPPGAGPPNPVLGLPAIVGEPADSLLGHLADEHGIGGDTGGWLLHAQGWPVWSRNTTSTTTRTPASSSATPIPRHGEQQVPARSSRAHRRRNAGRANGPP
jgi:hypothetical protein